MKRLYPLLFIFAVVLMLYYPALNTYFSQDDFFHFKISQTDGSLKSFLNLFGFYPFAQRGIAFYRPISRELPFNLYYSFFGLNAIPFRIFLFLIHFINIFLVYILIKKIFRKESIAIFAAFFFGITAANVATLYYLAGGIQTLLATTFTLTSLIFFHQYLENKKSILIISSFFIFLLGLGSHEQAIITPFLLIGIIIIKKSKKDIKNSLLILLPYFLVTCTLLYLEAKEIGFSSEEIQYQAVFNIKSMLNSFFWYISWALGIPETLIDFVLPGFILNPNLLKYWSNYYLFIFPSFFVSILCLSLVTIYLLLKKIVLLKNRMFLLFLIWFPLGLLPVILLPLHKSTHYLEISLPAFWGILGYITLNFYQEFRKKSIIISKIYLAIFILSLVILSTTSAILGSSNYWAASRGKLAEKLINEVRNTYPILPKGAIIYFKNDPNYPFLTKEWGGSSKQASIILNGADALQLLYKDSTIKVFYEDSSKPLNDNATKKIYSSVIKID